MMEQGLFNIQAVKNIADAIREKTGVSTQYKISEMAEAVQNIKTGSNWKVETEIKGNMVISTPKDMFKLRMNAKVMEDTVLLESTLQNAPVKVYGYLNGAETYIGEVITDNEGNAVINVTSSDYDSLKAVFEETEKFGKGEYSYIPDFLEAIFFVNEYYKEVWIDSGMVSCEGKVYIKFDDEEFIEFNPSNPFHRSGLDVNKLYSYIFKGNVLGVDSQFSEIYVYLNIPDSFEDGEALPGILGFEDSYKPLREIELSNNLNKLPVEYLSDCICLEDINIPASVRSIGYACFSGCSLLKNVQFNGVNITDLPDRCFYNNTSLETIRLPESLLTIGLDCFYGCSNLEYLEIPHSVHRFGQGGSNQRWISSECLKLMNIPNSLDKLPKNFFGVNSPVKHVVIPRTLEPMTSEPAFSVECLKNLPNLESITFRSRLSPCYNDLTINDWKLHLDEYTDDRRIIVRLPVGFDRSFDDFFDGFQSDLFVLEEYMPLENAVYAWNVNELDDLRVKLYNLDVEDEEFAYTLEYNPDEHCYVCDDVEAGNYKLVCKSEDESLLDYERIINIDHVHDNIFYFKLVTDINRVDTYLYQKNYRMEDLDYEYAENHLES